MMMLALLVYCYASGIFSSRRRLVVGPELVQILDFKTNRPAPPTEAGVPPLYLRQLAAYRAVLKDIFPGRAVRCLLLWTDGPRLMRISDAVIDGHVP